MLFINLFLVKMGLNDILNWIENQNIHQGILISVFIFGNATLAVVLSIICFIVKQIKILYNTIGAISAGALMAVFVNLILLPTLLIINVNTEIILYSGVFISIACYAFCLQYADRLWEIGKISGK